MPPRTAVASRAFKTLQNDAYICPSCLLRESPRGTSTPKDPKQRSYRTASRDARSTFQTNISRGTAYIRTHTRTYAANGSLASKTAINAPSTVPPRLRDLHQRLQLLQDKASSYVDLARLQLALRSLESSDPVIRIAFLGLGSNGIPAARRLAKLLLADELGEEAPWEKDLLVPNDGRSVLLKYGEPVRDTGVQGSGTTLVQEMRIPSLRLKRWNVEILITGLNASGYTPANMVEGVKELEESILVPPVTMPNSAGGRVGFVRYPVHKALIVADGVSGAVEFGRLPTFLADGKLINAALSLPMQAKNAKPTQEDGNTNAISIDLAADALELFRTSTANGAAYIEQWQQSRLGAISTWLAANSHEAEGNNEMQPAVGDMLDSLLSRAESSVASAEAAAETSSTALSVPDSKRTSLQFAIATWSEEAHRDLQVNLSAALITPTWRRTTWWRLFWRIDEVSISTGDVLRRGWLVEAEQSLAFVSGRILEAGVASVEELKGEPSTDSRATTLLDSGVGAQVDKFKATQMENAAPQSMQTLAELLQIPPMLGRVQEQTGLNAMFDPPWPQTINLARQQMLHREVPAIHRKAQALMLASLSTIGGSGALAGWLWVASGGVALYEAGAIAALGLVWALRRLQKKWSAERQTFTETAREDARRVLADVESKLKRLVQNGGRVVVRDEDRKEWQEARVAVRACRDAKTEIERDTE